MAQVHPISRLGRWEGHEASENWSEERAGQSWWVIRLEPVRGQPRHCSGGVAASAEMRLDEMINEVLSGRPAAAYARRPPHACEGAAPRSCASPRHTTVRAVPHTAVQRTPCVPPRAATIPGSGSRVLDIESELAQLPRPARRAFPLSPQQAAQPSLQPLVEDLNRTQTLRVLEVSHPAAQQRVQFLDRVPPANDHARAGLTLPRVGCVEDFAPPSRCAPAGRTKKRPREKSRGLFR